MSKLELSVEAIERWLKDSDCEVRAAAMNACAGKDVPLEVIERGLKDSACDVRAAAMNACEKNRIKIPASRTFDPPALVYKKCIADVIVVAEIPADAHVRGRITSKCRSSKAVIKDVLGDICDEKVGVSLYDKMTAYRIGDEVIIENFDFGCDECAAGFHFFCDLESAKNYNM